MKLLSMIAMILILISSAFASDCDQDDCDCITPCDDCTCDETVEDCTGDCCDCEAEECDEDCDCECDHSEHPVEIAEVVEEDAHCGGGCHGCPGE
ncbi:MAG: hypothetical protein KAS73_04265 [Candidatus Sabulitectum sp.]|nr:hypothetical protein [Candidatus Sabulitectum sp.]